MSQFNLSLFCSQKHPMSNPEKNYHFFQNIRILSRFSVQSITFFHKNIPCRIPKKKKTRCPAWRKSPAPSPENSPEASSWWWHPHLETDFLVISMEMSWDLFRISWGMSWGFIVISWEFHADEWEYNGNWLATEWDFNRISWEFHANIMRFFMI